MAKEPEKDVKKATPDPSAGSVTDPENVPYDRFKQVNDQKKQAEEERNRAVKAIQVLQQQLAAQAPTQPPPTRVSNPGPPPAAPETDFSTFPELGAVAQEVRAVRGEVAQLRAERHAEQFQAREQQRIDEARKAFELEVDRHLKEMPEFQGDAARTLAKNEMYHKVLSDERDPYTGLPKDIATIARETAQEMVAYREERLGVEPPAPDDDGVLPPGGEPEPAEPSFDEQVLERNEDGSFKMGEEEWEKRLVELTQNATGVSTEL